MYYDAQRKLAFVLPPRTGTTTFSELLSQWGAVRTFVMDQKSVDVMHPKPADVEITDFDQYALYGFFRNPLDRFLSIIRYIRNGHVFYSKFYSDSGITPEQFKQMNYDEMLDAFPKYQPLIPKFFDPQISWLANAKTLDFNNYTAEILRVARMFGVTQVNVFVNNWTDNNGEIPSQKVIDFVQAQYADDYRLGRERGLLT